MKHIFSDIDGTLVHHKSGNSILPKSALEALQQLRSLGHKVYLITGRSIFSAKEVIQEFKFDGYVCSLGSYIEIDDKVVVDDPFSLDQLREIFNIGQKYDIQFILEGFDLIHLDQRWIEEFKKYRDESDHKHYRILDYDYPYQGVYKVTFKALDKTSFLAFKDEVSRKYNVVNGTDLNAYFGEISTLKNTKALAIKNLIIKGLMNYDDCITIGDSPNDAEMLKYTKTSIAMGNALDEIKALASLVTDPVDQDGFYKAFKKLNII